jgi:tagaturonate epimerase
LVAFVRTGLGLSGKKTKYNHMKLGTYSFGIGDRFSMQGEAQLKAFLKARELGFEITPVWNKSNREHQTIGSFPKQTRIEADQAVQSLKWDGQYFVDADHINMNNVNPFVDHCDFFTIDVAEFIGKSSDNSDIDLFVQKNKKYVGELVIPGIGHPFDITEILLREIAENFLFAVKQAADIYRHILSKKSSGTFVVEISMDEVNEAQTPIELFFILSALSYEGVPVSTIAPKFTGRFNKGVDYVGDIDLFAREFEEDLLVLDYSVKEFNLPAGLKLSVHSGSDKFSIYPIMGNLIRKYNKGIHVKTAGTTWLEEAIGLAMAGGEALQLIKEIYFGALNRYDELAGPYATVIDINREGLPSAEELATWDGEQMAIALRHIPDHPNYNPNLRQLMHVAYKLAAEAGDRYHSLLLKHRKLVGEQVTENIFDRHMRRLFNL